MKYLLAPVVLVALLFAAPAYAETIVMECQRANEAGFTNYKYESPLFGKAKVFIREDGKWLEWNLSGTKDDKRIVVRKKTVDVGERGAVRENTADVVADQDWSGSNLKKGDEYQIYAKWVLDFAFFKYTQTTYMTKMDGSPLVPGKMDHDRAKPEIKERLCKKPDESWEDRETR